MDIVETKNAPAAIGPYSQAIRVNGLIFASGQIPVNPATGSIDEQDIVGQTKQVINNLAAVLNAAGSCLNAVIKTTCFLRHISDFSIFNEIYAQTFTGRPARSCVEVSNLPKGALVEIEVIAKAGAE
ncbi:MAG: RidA family protein [Verrucomicrobia bacterium]|nr:RidA family protein [Verrucomicrobiota bacterium]